MEQDELLKKFETEFQKVKKDLKFKSTLEDIDNIFFIKDLILQIKFVSPTLSRTICHRIVDLLHNWNGHLHAIVMPNPQNMINLTESELFDDAQKKELISIMNKIIALTSKNILIGLSKDKKQEAEFIDNSVNFWKKTLSPKLKEIIEKTSKYWEEKSKE